MLADSSLDNSEWIGAIHTETLKYLSSLDYSVSRTFTLRELNLVASKKIHNG